jgi:hypothetical protein
MRRIETREVALSDGALHPAIALSKHDLKLLLAVARAASVEQYERDLKSRLRLYDALDRLNARPSGKGKDDE